MEAMTERWTDGRMDDLSAKVDELGCRMENGFNRLDADIRALRDDTKSEFGAVRGEMKKESTAVRAEMKEGFEAVDKRFDTVDKRFEKVDERFEAIDARFERLDMLLLNFHGVLVRTCTAAVGLLAVLVTAIGIQV
ncbi:MAG TPA: hypothetical protein VFT10_04675 [Solirubrobacterales bacterium]|nr:hypothetical protein [Solirubrobacterales bacterium]